MSNIPKCEEHNYQFQHIVYWSGTTTLPGSSACDRYYADKYFCTKCLYTELINTRINGTTYSKPLEGTFPK